jgi:predicted Na+-dependent transporter
MLPPVTPPLPPLVSWQQGSGVVARRRLWANASGSFEQNNTWEDAVLPSQVVEESKVDFLKILKSANTVIPHIVLGSTILALVYPPSFTWFTTRPDAIAAGYIGQFIIKPLFGFLFGTLAVTVLNLPTALGAGIMLVSCVSGAQLSNYATFLTDPHMAPLSIVMTSLSTATAVFVTPTLSYFLIGQKLPVDVKGMMSSIVQIVVAPIAAGLLLNRFLPKLCAAIQPFLPPLSVFVTALCVGSPLAINIRAVLSPFGLSIVLLLFAFHTSSFVAGYHLAGTWFHKSDDVKALQRTISFETGMQSSLLALALANRFFPDPLVGVPPAISVVLMSLLGFALVMVWSKKMKM